MASWIISGLTFHLEQGKYINIFSCQENTTMDGYMEGFHLESLGDSRRPHGVTSESRSSRSVFEIQSELNCSDSQHAFVSRNQRASSAWASSITTHHTAGTNASDKKGGRKKLIPYWPVTQSSKGGVTLHAYRRGSDRVYDCIISPLPHQLLHPSVDSGSHPAGAERPGITHSFTS